MSFYDPDNFSDPSAIEYEKSHRLLQPIWDYIVDGREDMLRSPMFPPMLGVVFYFLATVPFTVVDLFFEDAPAIRKFKLQPKRRVTCELIRNSMTNAFWNHVLFIFPMATVQLIWVPPTPLPPVAPTLFEFLWQQVAFFIIFDFEYWLWHVIHHKVRFLYRWCHSVHHQYHAPFALATQYMHPWELFSIGMGVSVTPWLFKPHCLTYWSWFCLANWVSIEVHCGYDLPWAAHNFIPFYGGAPSHDLHHNRPLTNFGPWITFWDKLMGWKLTYKELEEMKKSRAATVGVYDGKIVDGLKQWN